MTDHHVANVSEIRDLDSHADDALVALIDKARAILAARKRERCRSATTEIRRLAREHGLDVSVKGPAQRAGRPRKGKQAG